MTPFPHLKETSQEAGGTPGVKKFQRKLQMNFKEDFVHIQPKIQKYTEMVPGTKYKKQYENSLSR